MGVAGDLAALGDELAEGGVVLAEDLVRGEAGVQHVKVEVVDDDGEGERAAHGLLLFVHERVVREERRDAWGARAELGAAELPAGERSSRA